MEEDEFIRHIMFRIPLQDIDRNEELFRLRSAYRYVIKTLADNTLDQSRRESLMQLQITIRERYLELNRHEIDDDL